MRESSPALRENFRDVPVCKLPILTFVIQSRRRLDEEFQVRNRLVLLCDLALQVLRLANVYEKILV